MNLPQLSNSGAVKGPPQAQVMAMLQPAVSEGQLPPLLLPSPPGTAVAGLPSCCHGVPELIPWQLPETISPFLVDSLQSRWLSYRTQLRRCKREFSEVSVHELRVATRRLIAQMVMLECVVPGATVRKARRLLKRRLKALSELRDTHVQRLFIERRLARFPELILLRDFVQRRERQLERTIAAKVNGFKNRALKECISRLCQSLSLNRSRARQPDRISRSVERATMRAFAEVVERRRAINPAVPGTIHRTRTAFKKFRYMVESLSPEFTGLSKSELRTLARYQRRMGTLQDLEVMQHCTNRFLGRHPGIEELLSPFGSYLQGIRARTLRSLLKSADDLHGFWPPTRVRSKGQTGPLALDAA